MLRSMMVAVAALVAVAAPGQAHVPPQPAAETAAEAQAFMASYARDLIAGDRAAIAARYSGQGAYMLGFEAKALKSPAELKQSYADQNWQKPLSFAWRDLSYEVIGPDAVVVTGGFDWGVAPGKPPLAITYTGLLRREDGAWRIRLEHENPLEPLPPRK